MIFPPLYLFSTSSNPIGLSRPVYFQALYYVQPTIFGLYLLNSLHSSALQILVIVPLVWLHLFKPIWSTVLLISVQPSLLDYSTSWKSLLSNVLQIFMVCPFSLLSISSNNIEVSPPGYFHDLHNPL